MKTGEIKIDENNEGHNTVVTVVTGMEVKLARMFLCLIPTNTFISLL